MSRKQQVQRLVNIVEMLCKDIDNMVEVLYDGGDDPHTQALRDMLKSRPIQLKMRRELARQAIQDVVKTIPGVTTKEQLK